MEAHDAGDYLQFLFKKGLSEEEIEKETNQKLKEWQGNIGKEYALFQVAKDHGLEVMYSEIHAPEEFEIDYNDFLVKISGLEEGLDNVVILGRILQVDSPRSFTRKDGSPGRFGKFYIQDLSGTLEVLLWEEASDIMNRDMFKENQVIQLIGGRVKRSEYHGVEKLSFHMGKRSKVIFAPENIPENHIPSECTSLENDLSIQKRFSVGDIKNREGYIAAVEGVVSGFEFKEINKKEKRIFLFKFILSDENSSIPVAIWDMPALRFLKELEEGDLILLEGVATKLNLYKNQKELHSTKNTSFQKL